VSSMRGLLTPFTDAAHVWVTIHPSYLLRVPRTVSSARRILEVRAGPRRRSRLAHAQSKVGVACRPVLSLTGAGRRPVLSLTGAGRRPVLSLTAARRSSLPSQRAAADRPA